MWWIILAITVAFLVSTLFALHEREKRRSAEFLLEFYQSKGEM